MEGVNGKSHVPAEIQHIVNVSVPNILLQYGSEWDYYIIGGRSYNLLMKTPVSTLDYDIKFNYPIESVVEIRDFILNMLKQQHPTLNVLSDDKPELARIIIQTGSSTYDIVDCGAIGPEQITSKYDIRQRVIIGPNKLRYGGLEYLLRRLEELTLLREQEIEVIESARSTYKLNKYQMDQLLGNLSNNSIVSKDLVDSLSDNVTAFGQSPESDNLIGSNIKQLISEITENLIDKYDLDSLDDYDDFINADNRNKWIEAKRPNGVNLSDPLDIVITLYIAEEVYTNSSTINADLSEKTDKYTRTLARLTNLKAGLLNPRRYYSEFFIKYLLDRCMRETSIETFLNEKFDCNRISK